MMVDETVLWQLSSDEAVNDGSIALARKLKQTPDQRGRPLSIRVEADRIILDEVDDDVLDHLSETLFSIIRDGLERTHQRSAIAYQINRELTDKGFGPSHPAWIPAPHRPLPMRTNRTFVPFHSEKLGQDGSTRYQDDRVTIEAFRSDEEDTDESQSGEASRSEANSQQSIVPFSAENVSINSGDERAVYKERSTYVGNPNSKNLEGLTPEIGQYIGAFVDALAGTLPDDAHGPTCQCCGSSTMPTGKVGEDEDEDEDDSAAWYGKVRYNQSSSPWPANDGAPQPLGQSAPSSSHNGRCVACILAGFYHGLRGKPVFEIDAGEQTKRVLVPVGDFERLNAVHALMDVRLRADDTMDADDDLRATVGVRTESRGFQALSYFSEMLREYSERVGSGPRNVSVGERLPTELRTYVAGRTTSGAREISSLERVNPGSWVYDLLSYQELPPDRYASSGSTDGYWPMDVLQWYAYADLSGEETLEHRKDQLVSGVLNQDFGEIVTAIAETYKRSIADDSPTMGRFHGAELHHYIEAMHTHMISSDAGEPLDEETRQSLARVAQTIGRAFDDPAYIGSLTRLQNASTRDGFEDALSRVAENLHKRRLEIASERRGSSGSSDDSGADADSEGKSTLDDFYSSYQSEDLERLFDVVISGNWRSIQRLLVAHAFLEAQSQYSYSEYRRRSNDDDSRTGDTESTGGDN